MHVLHFVTERIDLVKQAEDLTVGQSPDKRPLDLIDALHLLNNLRSHDRLLDASLSEHDPFHLGLRLHHLTLLYLLRLSLEEATCQEEARAHEHNAAERRPEAADLRDQQPTSLIV